MVGKQVKSMTQLKLEYYEEVFNHFQNSAKNSRCKYAVADQYGKPVCLRNFECPGLCNGPENCPYVLKKGECYGV
jgi:hypothetical protein